MPDRRPDARAAWPALRDRVDKEHELLRVLETSSASTVVSTFERPFDENGPQVVVIGSTVALAGHPEEAVAA